MASSLINVSKYEKKLRRLIQLNQNGATIYTEKTSLALALDVSRSEFIEAFKTDIDKTSKDLVNSLQIINSIKNGIVTEITTLDNDVESFFGNCYKNGIITLCGIPFNINKNVMFTKNEIVEYIYDSLFGINKKELSLLVKALTKYEEAKKDIDKALLYPSIVLADKLIEKIGIIDKKFNTFRNSMSYEEKLEFDISFNRSGVTEVIQHSTYVDIKGVRQIAASHKSQINSIAQISEGIKNNTFEYIEAVEIDGDGDCNKALKLINQIERQLKINCQYKFTLKFRKLGNLNARGIFFLSGFIIAEDVRDTSALLHEIAHFIHLSNDQIYTSTFVNYMINKLGDMIDFESLNVSEIQVDEFKKKIDYYTNPKEIVARALEIASLFAFEKGKLILGSDEFDLIKSRSYYEQLEGIYFNFKSFDEQTIVEMNKLYELFYETSYDEIELTGIDNFYKIDTKYRRFEREDNKTFSQHLKEEAKRSEKEKRGIYSFVNADNIDLILNHLPKSINAADIAKVIIPNINICGGYNKSLTAEEWANVIEDRSTVLMKLIESVKESMNEKEYMNFLIEIHKENLWEHTKDSIFLGLFSYEWKKKIKKCLINKYTDGYFSKFLANFLDIIFKTPLVAASSNLINDLDYVKEQIIIEPKTIRFIFYCENISKKSLEEYLLFFIEKYGMEKEYLIPSMAFEFKSICLKYFAKNNSLTFLGRAHPFNDDKEFIENMVKTFNDAQDRKKIIEFMSDELKEDESFMKSIGLLKKDDVEQNQIEEKINEIKTIQKENFDKLIESSTIEDFKHTQTGEILKVMKVKSYISDFNAFNEYLKNNEIAYYSKYARGFIIKNLEKVAGVAASVSIYNQETLTNFANGTLF